MLQLKLFTIFDSAIQAHTEPQFWRTAAEAERALFNTLQNPENKYARNPDHYTLFEIGCLDLFTGEFTPHATPHSHGLFINYMPRAA